MDRRVVEEQRLQKDLEQVNQVVVSVDVRQLMRQDQLQLDR